VLNVKNNVTSCDERKMNSRPCARISGPVNGHELKRIIEKENKLQFYKI
jgi:hypothetical protein